MEDSGDFDTSPWQSESFSAGWAPSKASHDYLGLLDIAVLAKLQYSIAGPVGKSHHLGSPGPGIGSLRLGGGLSFSVRRVPSNNFAHSINTWEEPLDKAKEFVVVKQPLLVTKEIQKEDKFENRLKAVMTELKILHHEGVRKHPNIIKLHHFMWDTQDNPTALAPSLILEYAELGTLADYQNLAPTPLPWTTKLEICADVAKGLQFLHQCGIIHGDVKTLNILVAHDSQRECGLRGKVSDFGSSMIEVFDDTDSRYEDLPTGTRWWKAPELYTKKSMDALELRRTDMYSYGLLVWKVMLDGTNPWEMLSWDAQQENIELKSNRHLSEPISETKFKAQDGLVELACCTIRDKVSSGSDSPWLHQVFSKTIRLRPEDRAISMKDIAQIIPAEVLSASYPTPEPKDLRRGDFGIAQTTFPYYVWLLRTTPPSFRALVSRQLAHNAEDTTLPKSKRAQAALALGLCYLQGFFAEFDKVEPRTDLSETTTTQRGQQWVERAAGLGSSLAGSIASRVLQNQTDTTSPMPQPVLLAGWLAQAMRRGSIRACHELERNFPTYFVETIRQIKSERNRLIPFIRATSSEGLDLTNLDTVAELDDVARSILKRPGATKLHQAAYLDSLLICKEIVSADTMQALAVQDEEGYNALHYASWGGNASLVSFFLQCGSDPNIQSKHGTTALHLALLSNSAEGVVSVLLSGGAAPNVFTAAGALQTYFGCHDYFIEVQDTPLHLAVMCGDIPVVSMLLDAGADPNANDGRGLSALETAFKIHSIPMIELLIPFAVMDDLPSEHDLYPRLAGYHVSPLFRLLFWEADGGDLEFVSSAIECTQRHGINLDYRGLFSAALDADNPQLVAFCMQKLSSGTPGASMIQPYRWRSHDRDENHRQVLDIPLKHDLHWLLWDILRTGSHSMISTVLQHMKQPLPTTHIRGVPYLNILGGRQFSSSEEASSIVKAIVAAGVDLTAVDQQGNGALRAVALWNDHHFLDALLQYPIPLADVERAMHYSVMNGGSWVAGLMIDSILKHRPEVLVTPVPQNVGFLPLENLEQPETNYLRALSDTWEFGRDDNINRRIMRSIIRHTKLQPGGPSVLKDRIAESRSFSKTTPLHHAARNGNPAAVQILLQEGANVNATQGNPLDDLLSSILGDVGVGILPAAQTSVSETLPASGGGPTPLDFAYERDWEKSLSRWKEPHRKAILKLRAIGGTWKEEADYNRRTQEVIKHLRQHGGKTSTELSNPSDTKPELEPARRAELLDTLKTRDRTQSSSDTNEWIYHFYGAAIQLPSSQLMLFEYPDIVSNPNTTHPSFSKFYQEAADAFTQLLNCHIWLNAEEDLHQGILTVNSRYETWASRNRVQDGGLDSIQHLFLDPESGFLASGLMHCFYELKRVLMLIKETVSSEVKLKNYNYRYTGLLRDLKRAVKLLTSEETRLSELVTQDKLVQ